MCLGKLISLENRRTNIICWRFWKYLQIKCCRRFERRELWEIRSLSLSLSLSVLHQKEFRIMLCSRNISINFNRTPLTKESHQGLHCYVCSLLHCTKEWWFQCWKVELLIRKFYKDVNEILECIVHNKLIFHVSELHTFHGALFLFPPFP
jgi:hypothetical protein